MRKIKLLIILSLLTDLFFFNKQIQANTVSPEVHKSCLQAKDYKGCIKANTSKSDIQITNRNPYEKCKMNTGRVGILTAYTPDGIYVFGESIDGSLKEGDIVTIPINGCPGETKFYPVIRNGKRINVRVSFYSKNDPLTEEHTKNINETRKSSILSFHEERIKNGADKVFIDHSYFAINGINKHTFSLCSVLRESPELISLFQKWEDTNLLAEMGMTRLDWCKRFVQKFQIKNDGERYLNVLWPFYREQSGIRTNYLQKVKIDCIDRTFDGEKDGKPWRSFDSDEGKNMANLDDLCKSEKLSKS
tara:strand:+ start:2256 stop:3167 length:912 start_codon:yes stop_codon:yes gene_type:complete